MGFNIGKILGSAAKGFVNYATPIGWGTMAAGALTGKPGLRATDMAVPYAEAVGALIPGNPLAGPMAADAARRGYAAWNKSPSGDGKIGKMEGGAAPGTLGKMGVLDKAPAAAGGPSLPSWYNAQEQPTDFSSASGVGYGYDAPAPVSHTPDEDVLARYGTPSAQEQQHSANVSELARTMGDQGTGLYNVSNPLYQQAANYYGQILSGSKTAATQAIAPEAEMIAELNAGQQKGIEKSGLRGGARDTALAESGRAASGQIAGLIPKARQNAAAAGGQLAMQGMGLGVQQQGAATSAYDSLLGKEQQNRQNAISAEQNNRFQAAGIDVQKAQLQLQGALGMRGLDIQQMGLALNEKLGMRGLDLQAFTSMNSLELQRELGRANINISQQQVDVLKQQLKNEADTKGGQAIGDIGSMIVTTLGLLLGGKGGGGGSTSPAQPPSTGNTYAGM